VRAIPVGGRLGPYCLDAVLGHGATGTVFRAAKEGSGRTLALKVIRSELAGDPSYRRRFLREVRAAREIRHPCLVPVLDAGEIEGRQFLAMPLIEGRSLAAVLAAEAPLAPQRVVDIVRQLAAGLDALHRHGIVHRDVKPSNVLIDGEDAVCLTDFGLAKGDSYSLLTSSGRVVGSVQYIAPEVILGRPATPASDIYSLGCLAFECAAGRPPFAGRSVLHVAFAHLHELPPDPRSWRADLSGGFAWALLRALDKDPASRPPTAVAYATLLGAAKGGRSRLSG
jgi:serine/threonine-protein kinase